MKKLLIKEMSDPYVRENFKRIQDGVENIYNNYTESKTARFGNKLGYTVFEEDGTLRFGGKATVWKDTNVGGIALTRAAVNRPSIINLNSTNIIVYGFDGGASLEEVHGNFEIDHDYKEGTNIKPHLHWLPTTSDSGNVKWFLEYYISRGGKAPVTGTSSLVSPATGVAWDEIRESFEDIPGAGVTIGNQMFFRLYRSPTGAEDTYGFDAALATFGIHYEIDTIGSREVFIK